MNNHIETALRTWYPKDNKLHYDFHHPLMKLAGEWGELLDDYAKQLYKPKHKEDFIKELGDCWYYTRILAHQYHHKYSSFEMSVVGEFELSLTEQYGHDMTAIPNNDKYDLCIDSLIAIAGYTSFGCLLSWKYHHSICKNNGDISQFEIDETINVSYSIILRLCQKISITLDELTQSNWEKLKPGSERGEQWRKAWEQSD